MQLQVERATGRIVGVGDFPSGSLDPGVVILEASDAALRALGERGEKFVDLATGAVSARAPSGGSDPTPPRSANETRDRLSLRQYLASVTPDPTLAALIRLVLGE